MIIQIAHENWTTDLHGNRHHRDDVIRVALSVLAKHLKVDVPSHTYLYAKKGVQRYRYLEAAYIRELWGRKIVTWKRRGVTVLLSMDGRGKRAYFRQMLICAPSAVLFGLNLDNIEGIAWRVITPQNACTPLVVRP